VSRPIQQSVTLPASPKELYETFIESKKHSAMTGMPARLSKEIGGKWAAFGGSIWGRNILFVPGKMVVQTWRSTGFKKTDEDSILVVTFTKAKGGTRIDLVHVNVSPSDHRGVTEGWKQYYWKPWRKYLKKKR
jgi:activator of HSP90 ATPase